jgi:hypothetical protein
LYIKDSTGTIKVNPNYDDHKQFKMNRTALKSTLNIDELLESLNLSVEQKNDIKNCELGKRVVKYVVEEYTLPLDQCFTLRSSVKETDAMVCLNFSGSKTFNACNRFFFFNF